MKKVTIECRVVFGQTVEGRALVTNQPLCIYDSLDPESGFIINRRHELYGENVLGKILVFPHGIGSSTSSATILEACRSNKAPKAIINLETDPIIALGAVLAEKLYGKIITLVDRPKINPSEVIKKGDWVKVNADVGIMEISKDSSYRD